MSTHDDIYAERDAAVAILDQKLIGAGDLKNGGAAGMDDVINSLEQQKADVDLQAYTGAMENNAMVQALAALKAATDEMNTVAETMVSATTYISNVASLGTTADKVVSALKGAG